MQQLPLSPSLSILLPPSPATQPTTNRPAPDTTQTLPFLEAEAAVKRFGKPLVESEPRGASRLIVELCTGKFVPTEELGALQSADADALPPMPSMGGHGGLGDDSVLQSRPDDFVHLFVEQPRHLRRFLQQVLEHQRAVGGAPTSMLVGNTLLELLLLEWGEKEEAVACSSGIGTGIGGGGGHLGGARGGTEEVIALHEAEEAVLKLLGDPLAKYDADHALCLVTMHCFRPGKLFLYQKMRSHHLVLQHYMEGGDVRSVVAECKQHGSKDPAMWVQVLDWFATEGGGTDSAADAGMGPGGGSNGAGMGGYGTSDAMVAEQRRQAFAEGLQDVLAHIAAYRLVPPLRVLQTMAGSRRTTLSSMQVRLPPLSAAAAAQHFAVVPTANNVAHPSCPIAVRPLVRPN